MIQQFQSHKITIKSTHRGYTSQLNNADDCPKKIYVLYYLVENKWHSYGKPFHW